MLSGNYPILNGVCIFQMQCATLFMPLFLSSSPLFCCLKHVAVSQKTDIALLYQPPLDALLAVSSVYINPKQMHLTLNICFAVTNMHYLNIFIYMSDFTSSVTSCCRISRVPSALVLKAVGMCFARAVWQNILKCE